jgi:hypothetical protein
MADPVTLTVLGSWAAAEGIKFLYEQAGELIKARHEKRTSAETKIPIRESPALEGVPSGDTADLVVVEREHQVLADLSDALAPYVEDPSIIDLQDADLAATAGRLRAALEAVYGQRFTFNGERRESTGTRVTVSQILGTANGTVTGVEADVESSAAVDVDVEQRIDHASKGSSITGFKGTIR